MSSTGGTRNTIANSPRVNARFSNNVRDLITAFLRVKLSFIEPRIDANSTDFAAFPRYCEHLHPSTRLARGPTNDMNQKPTLIRVETFSN